MEKVGSSNLVTGSCNSNFTQFRHLRYYDQKVTSCGTDVGVTLCNPQRGVMVMAAPAPQSGSFSPGQERKLKVEISFLFLLRYIWYK